MCPSGAAAAGDRSPISRTDRRRTDTRRRIHDVALKVFSERGWEGATMREIAELLGITRPALYHHFRNKEDILASIHHELAVSIDDILTPGREEQPTAQNRVRLLERLSDLIAGPWGPFIRFAQADESAMRNLTGVAEFSARIDELAQLLQPDASIRGRIEGRLALTALFVAGTRSSQLGGTPTERREAAIQVAQCLVAR